MKKTITIISAVCITMMACSKTGGTGGGGTPTPTPTPKSGSKGYIRVTFGGKTLEARDTVVNDVLIAGLLATGINISSSGGKYYSTLYMEANHPYQKELRFRVNTLSTTLRESSDNSKLGVYPIGDNDGIYNYVEDINAGGAKYIIDTTSRATITTYNSDYSEGTLKLTLTGSGGAKTPATGVFKIYFK